MARLAKTVPQAVIRADWWDETETVTIKTYVGSFDRGRIKAAIYNVRPNQQLTEQMLLNLCVHEAALTKLEIGVAGWTFAYEDGSAIPLSRDTLAQLDERDADFILQELTKRWDPQPQQDPEVAKQREAKFQEDAALGS